MLDDDDYASKTIAGILAWTLPSAMDIFSSPQKKVDYYDFDNFNFPSASNLEFEVSVVA